jgi:hypothetical protein
MMKVSCGDSRPPAQSQSARLSLLSRLEGMRSTLASNHQHMVVSAFELASHLALLPQSAHDQGTLELECYVCTGPATGSKRATGWTSALAPLDAQMVLTALERGATRWTSQDNDWRLVYDSYVQMPDDANATPTRVRLRSVDGVPEDNITKTLLARTDFSAHCAKDAVGGESVPLQVRFQAKLERKIQLGSRNRVMLLPPESVRVSMRRSFVLESKSMRHVRYRFTVIKAWTGRTAQEAERLMHSEVDSNLGQSSVEIEVELAWPDSGPERLLYCCLGLLLKTQDLVELLSGSRELVKRAFIKMDDTGTPINTRMPRKPRSTKKATTTDTKLAKPAKVTSRARAMAAKGSKRQRADPI